MQNIVVAIDFSPITENLIAQARRLARAFQAKLWLIHVAAPEPDFIGYEVGPQHVRENRAGTLRDEHRKLQAYARQLSGEGLTAEALLIQGPTVKTLLEEANDVNADLILVGAHRHGFLYETVVGNTWSELIRAARVPLLVVPEGGG